MIRRSVVSVLMAVSVLGVAPAVTAAPNWAPASKATIHPGVRMTASGKTCTANFVFYDARAVYLGLAAGCSPSLGTYVDIDRAWRPGTKVKIEGASRPGTIVYNSWITSGISSNDSALRANNFALARLDNVDKGKVNPSIPYWGGPTKGEGRSSAGNPVYSYGNADSPSGSTDRSPKLGVDTSPVETNVTYADEAQRVVHHPFRSPRADGWTRYAQMLLPGAADLGAPVLDARGRAFGVLGPWAHDTSNRVTDLSKAIAYMKSKTNLDGVRLATGTTAFVPPA